MAEQLTTDIEEFFMIRRTVIEPYFSMFAAADADWATVLLITIVGVITSFPYFWYGCRLLGAVWQEWFGGASYRFQEA
jgi:hypothetical protein